MKKEQRDKLRTEIRRLQVASIQKLLTDATAPKDRKNLLKWVNHVEDKMQSARRGSANEVVLNRLRAKLEEAMPSETLTIKTSELQTLFNHIDASDDIMNDMMSDAGDKAAFLQGWSEASSNFMDWMRTMTSECEAGSRLAEMLACEGDDAVAEMGAVYSFIHLILDGMGDDHRQKTLTPPSAARTKLREAVLVISRAKEALRMIVKRSGVRTPANKLAEAALEQIGLFEFDDNYDNWWRNE